MQVGKLYNPLFWIITLLVINWPSHSETILSKKEFTDEFIEQIQAEVNGIEITVKNELELKVTDNEGLEVGLFLNNAYNSYQSGSASLEEVITAQVKAFKSRETAEQNQSIEQILPVLKPKEYLETVKQQLKSSGYSDHELPFYYKELNGDIYQLFVFDSPESMSFVTTEDIVQLGIQENISAKAAKNLESYYALKESGFRQVNTRGQGQVYMFVADENYEASVLLAENYLASIEKELSGEAVVYLPARNIVLVVGSADVSGNEFAKKLAIKGYSELGYSISPYGYIKKEHQWVRFEL